MSPLSTIVDGQSVTWRDRRRWLWLLGLVVPLLPVVGGAMALGLGIRAGWWMGPLFVVAIAPMLDLLAGNNEENPPDWAQVPLEADRYYRWCTFVFVPVQYASFIAGCWVAVRQPGLLAVDRVGLCFKNHQNHPPNRRQNCPTPQEPTGDLRSRKTAARAGRAQARWPPECRPGEPQRARPKRRGPPRRPFRSVVTV